MIYVLPTTYSSYQIGSYKGGGKVPAAAERRCPHYSREKGIKHWRKLHNWSKTYLAYYAMHLCVLVGVKISNYLWEP